MMVLKPNGIFQALYAEFQLIARNPERIKSQPELYYFSIFLYNIVFVYRIKLNNTIVAKNTDSQ
jgi:hypothetical protein